MSLAHWLPANGSLHGVLFDRLLGWNLLAITILLLLAHVALGALLLRSFRAHRRATGGSRSTWWLEILPLAACTLLFAIMAAGSEHLWASLRYEGAAPGAMQVEVVGVQFQWYFRYPGADGRFGQTRPQLVAAAAGNPLGIDPSDPHGSDDLVSSVLMLPAGREVDLRLRADDVIHGFFIPGMRLKQNAVPGLELHVHFTPVTPGDYPILCTQVCGSGHSRMQALLRVLPPDLFAGWLSARASHAAGATGSTLPTKDRATR